MFQFIKQERRYSKMVMIFADFILPDHNNLRHQRSVYSFLNSFLTRAYRKPIFSVKSLPSCSCTITKNIFSLMVISKV